MTTTVRTPVQTVQAAYEAFGSGDLAAFAAVMADDVVWRVSDTGPLDGTFTGMEEVGGFLQRLVEATEGTFTLEVVDMLVGETRVATLARESAVRDGQHHAWDVVHVAEVSVGRVVRFDASSSDPANRAYWAR